MAKKNKIVIIGLLVLAVGGSGVFFAYNNANAGKPEIVQKEVLVKKGDLTVGVTESGSVAIGTMSQDLEALEDVLGSSAASSSSGNSGNSAVSSMGGEAMLQTASAQNSSSGSTNSSSDSTEASLEVEEVYLAIGQKVAVGEPVLKLSTESVDEYRQQLEADVESTKLALEKAEYEAKSQKLNAKSTYNSNVAEGNVAQSEYDITIAQLQASVDSAQAAVNDSAGKIADYQKKIAKGKDFEAALAEEQANYNTLVTKLQSAQNEQATKTVEAQKKYQEAMFDYNNASSLYTINVSGVDSDVEDAKDAYEKAQEALSNYSSLIGDGVIYSQYAGTVASIGYAAGDILSSSTEVITFSDETEVTMTVSVSQEDIASVEIGDVVEIALTAYEDTSFKGIVESMDTSSSSGTSTVSYDVTVAFTEDTSKVYQDMTGSVTFISEQAEDVCYISRKAIIRDRQNSYVKVKRSNGDIEQVEVTTGISDGINIEISSGLEEGDTVIIESQVSAP
ncbi:MAG: HlyD family efflux transporter periplasmic adaptor subunit [Lachnospiraceae bacterium]|nr:HlyD family efflux transporter periplasmic adaptor subunit [Lachnospiraceae bacterium]